VAELFKSEAAIRPVVEALLGVVDRFEFPRVAADFQKDHD
jgi:hypothetical protein